MHEIMSRIFDEDSFDEYKQNYGKTLICGTATLGGYNIGVVANQKTVQNQAKAKCKWGE